MDKVLRKHLIPFCPHQLPSKVIRASVGKTNNLRAADVRRVAMLPNDFMEQSIMGSNDGIPVALDHSTTSKIFLLLHPISIKEQIRDLDGNREVKPIR